MRPKGKLPDWNQHGAGKWPICVRIGVMDHYLLPELTQAETRAILERALGPDATEKVITMIHSVTGGIFRSVDMQDLVKTAASRLMI